MSLLIETVSDSTKARKDLDALKKSVGGIETSVKSVTENFKTMALQIGTAVGAFSATKELLKMSDTMTNLENKIKAVSESTNDYKKALQGIKDLAISTRSDLAATAGTYQRIAINQKELGISVKTTLRVVEILNKSLKIGGASATEATSALLQFGQALGSGTLAGDELKSLAETAPTLLKALADGIGVPVGQLKAMGAAGKLVSSVVLPALLKAGEKVDKQFAGMKVTFGDAFTTLSTGFILLKDSISKYFFGSKNTLATWLNEVGASAANVAKYFSYYMTLARSKVAYFVLSSITLIQQLFPELSAVATSIGETFSKLFEGITPDFAGAIELVKRGVNKIGSVIANGLESALSLFANKLQTDYVFAAWIASLTSSVMYGFGALLKNIESWKIDPSKFFVGFEAAKKMVLDWAYTVERAFFWILDRVILHSWIPDLVIGVGVWMKKLLLTPLATVKFFAKSVSGIFKGMLSILTLGLFNKGLGSMVLKLSAVAALFGGVFALYKKFDYEKNTSPQQKLLDDLFKPKSTVSTVIEKASDKFKSFGQTLKKTLNDNFFSKTLKQAADIKDKAKKSAGGAFDSLSMPDQMKNIIPSLQGVFQSIPTVLQAPLAIGISLAFGKALSTLSSNSTVSKGLGILGATFAAGFFAKVLNPSLFTETIYGVATKFLQVLTKGFDVLLGGNAFKNPLGLISLLAKFALLFAAGRKFLGGVAGKVLQAPSNVGRGIGTRLDSAYAEKNIKGLTREMADMPQKLTNANAVAQRKLNARVFDLARQTGTTPQDARVNIQNSAYAASNPATSKLLADARAANDRFANTQAALSRLPSTLLSLKQNLNDKQVESGKLKLALLDRKEKFQDSTRNTLSALGGVVGGVGGLQIGAEFLKIIPNAPEWVKVATVLASGFIGQVIGSSLGSVLGSSIIFAMEKGGSAVARIWNASPWWLQLIAGVALALFVGYKLFMSLPKAWGEDIKRFFGGSGEVTKTDLAGGAAVVGGSILGLLSLGGVLKQIPSVIKDFFSFNSAFSTGPSLVTRLTAWVATAFGAIRTAPIVGPVLAALESFVISALKFLKSGPLWVKIVSIGLLALLGGNVKADTIDGTPTKPAEKDFLDIKKDTRNSTVPFIKSIGLVTDIFVAKVATIIKDRQAPGGVTSSDLMKKYPSTLGNLPEGENYGREYKRTSIGQAPQGFLDGIFQDIKGAVGDNPLGLKAIKALEDMSAGFTTKGADVKDALSSVVDNIKTGGKGLDPYVNTGTLSTNQAVDKKTGKLLPSDFAVQAANSFNNNTGKDGLSIPASDVQAAITADPKLVPKLAELSTEINKWTELISKQTDGSSVQMQSIAERNRVIGEASNLAVTGIFGEDSAKKSAGKGTQGTTKGVGYGEVFKIVSESFPKLGLIAEEFKAFGDAKQFDIFEKAAELYNKTTEINNTLVAQREKAKTGKNADGSIADKSVFGLDEKAFNDLNAKIAANEAERIRVQDELVNSLISLRSNANNLSPIFQKLGVTLDKKAIDSFGANTVKELRIKGDNLDAAKTSRDNVTTGDSLGAFAADRNVKIAQKEFDASLDKAMSGVTDPVKFAFIGTQLGVSIEEATYNMLSEAQKASISAAFATARKAKEEIANATTAEERQAGQRKLNDVGVKVGEVVTKAVSNPAQEAGKAYASSVRASFESGVRGIFDGKNDGKGVLMTAFDTFATGVANSVFDGLTKSLSEALFSPDKIKGGLEGAGASLFNFFGKSADKPSTMPADGMGPPTPGAEGSILGGLKEKLSGAWDALPSIFSDSFSMLKDTLSGAFDSLKNIDFGGLLKTGLSFMGFADGGYVSGAGHGTSDSIPAMLSNGEFVTNAAATRKFGPLLHAINSGNIGRFAAGGLVGSMPTIATIQTAGNNSASSSQSTFNINVTGNISQQTRSEIQRMIPQIARGTDKHRSEVRQRR